MHMRARCISYMYMHAAESARGRYICTYVSNKSPLPISIDELVVTWPIEPFISVAKCYFTNVDGLVSAAYTSL